MSERAERLLNRVFGPPKVGSKEEEQSFPDQQEPLSDLMRVLRRRRMKVLRLRQGL